MEVNTNIYGNEDMWITVNPTNWGSNVPEEEKIKVANFTDLTPEELGNNPDPRKASALGCAAYKMSQDTSWTINGDDGAFNKSVSFVGMAGNKCPYTSIKYFSNINNDQYTSNYPITQLESDTYDIVNFAFHNAQSTLRNDYGNNKRFMDIYKSAQSGGGSGNAVKDPYVRWNPDPFLGNGPSSTYPNYLNSSVSDYASSIRNQDINFITQMPCRRVVLVPFITCSDGNDSSVATYDLDKYLTTYKTTKPRIISVSFAAYIAYKDSDAPTSSDKRQLKYFAMSLLQSSNKFSNHYITIQGSNTRQPAENVFYPYLLMSPYIPLGGALNNGHSTNNKPSGLSNQTWSSSGGFDNSSWYSVMAVCDLGDMGWTNWSGNNTGETGRGEYLYCNADNLTDDEIRESVRAGLACFGMFFTDSAANAETKQLDDAGMFLGTLVDGIGYGDYTEGTANRAQPQFNWKAMNENDYDPLNPTPGPGPAPDPDTNPIKPSTPGFSLAVDNGSVCYTINKAEWRQIWNDIYGGSTRWKDLIDGLQLYGSNPLNAILNFRWYPFTLGGSITSPLRLGATTVQPSTHVYHYISSGEEAFTSASASFYWGRPKNFINSRKTKVRIWLPFYGFYELPTSLFISKELSIQFQYNLPDDQGVWFIMFGGSIYDYVECAPYIEIPITGDNSLQIAAAKKSRNLQIAATIASTVAGIAMGAAVAAPGLKAIIDAARATGGNMASAALANIGPLAGENLLTAAHGAGIMGATGALASGGIKVANTMMNSALQIGTLSTNVPIHSTASDTTFLHLPFHPYIEVFQNLPIGEFSGKEADYMRTVGIACDKWDTIDKMPENSMLATTGAAAENLTGMELSEANELNAILQSGFMR